MFLVFLASYFLSVASISSILSVTFLTSYAFSVLETEGKVKDYFINPNNKYYYYLFGVNVFIMAFFSADYIARFWSATSKKMFLK